jgi:hypothetical protein
LPNTFTLAGYDCRIFYCSNSAVLFDIVPSAADLTNVYELTGVKTISIGNAPERLNGKQVGSREREHKNVLKTEHTLSIECYANVAGNDIYDLLKTADDGPMRSATTPGQLAIYIHVNADRDLADIEAEDADDVWHYTYSAFVDKADMSGGVNDMVTFKVDFCLGKWNDPTMTLPTEIGSSLVGGGIGDGWNAAAGTPLDWTSGQISKLDGDLVIAEDFINNTDDTTTDDGGDQGANAVLSVVSSSAVGDDTQTVTTAWKNAAGAWTRTETALNNNVAQNIAAAGDTVIGAWLDAATVGTITIAYGGAPILVWDGSAHLGAGMLTASGGNSAFAGLNIDARGGTVTFTCSNAAATDFLYVYGTDAADAAQGEGLTLVAGVATTAGSYHDITEIYCSNTENTETFDITTSGSGTTWTQAEVTIDYAESYTVSLNNNCIKRYGWTNTYPRMIELGAKDVTGTLTVDMTQNYYQLMELVNEEYDTLQIDFDTTNGDFIQLENTSFDSSALDMTEVQLTMNVLPFTADDLIFVG